MLEVVRVFGDTAKDRDAVRAGEMNPRACLQVYALRSACDKLAKAVKDLEGQGKVILEAFLVEQQQQKVRLETSVGPRTASLRPFERAWVRKADVESALDYLRTLQESESDLGEQAGRTLVRSVSIDSDELLALVKMLTDLNIDIPPFLNHEEGVNVGFTGR